MAETAIRRTGCGFCENGSRLTPWGRNPCEYCGGTGLAPGSEDYPDAEGLAVLRGNSGSRADHREDA